MNKNRTAFQKHSPMMKVQKQDVYELDKRKKAFFQHTLEHQILLQNETNGSFLVVPGMFFIGIDNLRLVILRGSLQCMIILQMHVSVNHVFWFIFIQ